jgi:hypothetical protein
MTSTTTDSSVAETAGAAKEQASQVAGATVHAAGEVAGTAKGQAANVVGEAVAQTQDLIGQATEQINTHASEQTQRLSQNIRQLGEHLSQMASAGQPGTAQSVVRAAAQHAERSAGYLDSKQPGELMSDLQSLGRRRPGAFLLGAALAGVVAGRLAGAAKRATGGGSGLSGSSPTGVETTPVSEPVSHLSNVTPGSPTIEPYPDTTSGRSTL